MVREVGQDVTGFSAGDEVFGAVAPHLRRFQRVHADHRGELGTQTGAGVFTDAATQTVAAATAYDGVTQLALEHGQTLLINGISGGVGVAAAQIACDLGVNVIGTAGADKRPLVESLGATLFPYGDSAADSILATMPDGVDAILDLAGGAGLRAVS